MQPLETFTEWTAAAIAAAASLILLFFLRAIIMRRLNWLSQNVHAVKSFPITDVFAKTHTFFLVIVALYIGTLFLKLSPKLAIWPNRILLAAFVLQIGLWGNELLLYFIRNSKLFDIHQDTLKSGSISVINVVSKAILWSIVTVFFLSNLGFNVSALIAGLGIGGVAVALSVQNILGDLFASLSIVIDKPFKIGDTIVVDDIKGSVEHIGLKTTRLRSVSGELIVFSNNDLLSSRIRNYKQMTHRRVNFDIQVALDTDPTVLAKIPEIIRQIILPIQHAAFDYARFRTITESANVFEIVYHIDLPENDLYLSIQQQINIGILKKFQQEKIEFPQYVYYQTKAKNG